MLAGTLTAGITSSIRASRSGPKLPMTDFIKAAYLAPVLASRL